MRLLALVESAGHVCCRYRVEAFRPWLQEAGHFLQTCAVPRRMWDWPNVLVKARRADAVLIQRRLPHPFALALLRRAARRLIFDFDDAVFMHDSYDARGPRSPVRERRFAGMVASADVVAAGNAFLGEQARRWSPKDRVRIVPTCVDPVLYPLAEHRRGEREARLVWIGSSSTLQGLERITPLLEHVGQSCPGLSLHLVCDRFLNLEKLRIVPCPWSEAGEAEALAASDIGISWVPDDRWSRGKCGLKVLQYMAAGLPVVANRVGVQCDLVRHGESGFLAETPEEWADAIRRLAADPELRRRMGEAGRARLEREFSVRAGAAAWLALLEELKGARQAA